MGLFSKLKQGLSKTKSSVFGQVGELLRSMRKVDEEALEELLELLVMADVGYPTAQLIIDRLREQLKERKINDGDEMQALLCDILVELAGDDSSLTLETTPSVILVVGVNGVGKTTSIAKMANMLKQEGKKVMLAAADTFRAGAIAQLEVWAGRVDVDIIRQSEGSDPAAVVFDAAAAAKKRGADVLIVDTAGRLHNKKNLMNELEKIGRVLDRELPGASRETLLVIDSTTGQNALSQAKEFAEITGLTGIVLTKLDGTAKGGAVLSVKHQLGIPVKFIGVGEQMDDLQAFEARAFVEALFE